mmetsp:Transcript_4497/g.13640  ORF Transcript_4497/g.13640 Transcript_4497/m.13640 type:complete len:340 (+) Transcript_4497:223-1242(+)
MLGYVTHDRYEEMKPLSNDANSSMVVDANDASTTLFAKLVSPARVQTHLAPKVSADPSDIVDVSTRGYGAVEGSLLPEPIRFEVNYLCKKAGEAAIELRLPIPPFNDVVKSWRKQCSTAAVSPPSSYSDDVAANEQATSTLDNRLDSLDIGTKYGTDDVISNGTTSEAYSIAFSSGLEANDYHAHVGKNDSTVDFWVHNPSTSTSTHVIDRISITIRNRNLLLAKVTSTMTLQSALSSAGGKIEPGESSRLSVHFICKAAGQSAVLITLASLYHANVEFGFVKECKEPEVIIESGTFRTARSLMHVFLFMGLLTTGMVIYYMRRKRKGYSGVAQTALSA